MNPRFVMDGGRAYGALELKRVYQTNLALGLIMAIGLHLAGLGIGLLYAHLTREPVLLGPIDETIYTTLDAFVPPTVVLPPLEVSEPAAGARPEVGIPRAVPDESVKVEITIASRHELNRHVGTPTNLESSGPGGIWEVVPHSPEPDPGINDFVKREKEPVPVATVGPAYPSLALETGLSAVVMVRVKVDKYGRVKDAVAYQSTIGGLGFEEAAVAAALQWVFTPAEQNGHPIAVWINIPFNFRAR